MGEASAAGSTRTRAIGAIAMVSASLLTGGCASIGEPGLSNLFAESKPAEQPEPGQAPQTELQKATEYWGKEYSQKPGDLDTALSYAKNLKALGQKQQALGVLQQASMFHATDRKLNSEYGRLALELDQVPVAKKLLEAADDPVRPDWRVLSARGTILAKEGKHAEAIGFYERALQLSANQPSVMNNLALAYAMNGEAARAEEMLRKVSGEGGASAKVRQNLALVLGLQGKYDEATKVGSEAGSTVAAAENTNIIKKIVRLEPKPYAPIPAGGGVWETKIAAPGTEAAPIWKTKVASAPVPQVVAKLPAPTPAPAAVAPSPALVSAPAPVSGAAALRLSAP